MQQLVQNLLAVGLHHYLILAVVLFGIGTFGVFHAAQRADHADVD
jgi:hypothetical protein